MSVSQLIALAMAVPPYKGLIIRAFHDGKSVDLFLAEGLEIFLELLFVLHFCVKYFLEHLLISCLVKIYQQAGIKIDRFFFQLNGNPEDVIDGQVSL